MMTVVVHKYVISEFRELNLAMFAHLVEGRLVVCRDVAKGGIILVEKPVILQALSSAPFPF